MGAPGSTSLGGAPAIGGAILRLEVILFFGAGEGVPSGPTFVFGLGVAGEADLTAVGLATPDATAFGFADFLSAITLAGPVETHTGRVGASGGGMHADIAPLPDGAVLKGAKAHVTSGTFRSSDVPFTFCCTRSFK